jgi:predicted transcriptional regulator of viral defense system
VLDDMGHAISANHLSVLLTRLAQSEIIERVGRGRYRAR